jgi:hypothetical protein
MKNIVWLASYPKSGNTWFRIFLSNLRSEQPAPIDINEIQTDGIFSSKTIVEKATGIDVGELTQEEADLLRPDVFRYYSSRFDDLLFIKAHDAYTYLSNGAPIFPSDVSYGAIYFVRNPLAVAVSFAFHLNKELSFADQMLNQPMFLAKQGRKEQLRQQLLTWESHVKSWTQQQNIRLKIVRYEDMKLQPLETFRSLVQFLGWDYNDEAILKAIENSSFEILKKQEEKGTFIERIKNQKKFFRSGKINDWQNHLSPQQIENIITFNQRQMTELGYIEFTQKMD